MPERIKTVCRAANPESASKTGLEDRGGPQTDVSHSAASTTHWTQSTPTELQSLLCKKVTCTCSTQYSRWIVRDCLFLYIERTALQNVVPRSLFRSDHNDDFCQPPAGVFFYCLLNCLSRRCGTELQRSAWPHGRRTSQFARDN